MSHAKRYSILEEELPTITNAHSPLRLLVNIDDGIRERGYGGRRWGGLWTGYAIAENTIVLCACLTNIGVLDA